jgi:hypothetical protein
VEFRQTFDDVRHYAIYDEPERVFAFAAEEAIPIRGAIGE